MYSSFPLNNQLGCRFYEADYLTSKSESES